MTLTFPVHLSLASPGVSPPPWNCPALRACGHQGIRVLAGVCPPFFVDSGWLVWFRVKFVLEAAASCRGGPGRSPLAAACAQFGFGSVEVAVDIAHVVPRLEAHRPQSSRTHLVAGDRTGSDPIQECVDIVDPVALAPSDDPEATRI